jgi:hypothetical protein
VYQVGIAYYEITSRLYTVNKTLNAYYYILIYKLDVYLISAYTLPIFLKRS